MEATEQRNTVEDKSLAESLIRFYGAKASDVARDYAEKNQADGDESDSQLWQRVATLIGQMLR
jgi:hypothetical protein